MSRFLAPIVTAAMLIWLAAFVSACTTQQTSNRADFQYQPRHSVNPACSQGFRPTNALSCSY